MKVYKVIYECGWGERTEKRKIVLASGVEQCAKDAARWGKKNLSNPEVKFIELLYTIDVFYKS